MTFNLSLLNGAADSKPVRWQWLRLEDRKTEEGSINGNEFSVNFTQSGSYTVNVLAQDGTILGATSHWVSGPDLKVPVGNIEIVWDKASYQWAIRRPPWSVSPSLSSTPCSRSSAIRSSKSA
jgi:hypothetical protein